MAFKPLEGFSLYYLNQKFKEQYTKLLGLQHRVKTLETSGGGSSQTLSFTAPDNTVWFVIGVTNGGALITSTTGTAATIDNLSSPDGSVWAITGITNDGALITTKQS